MRHGRGALATSPEPLTTTHVDVPEPVELAWCVCAPRNSSRAGTAGTAAGTPTTGNSLPRTQARGIAPTPPPRRPGYVPRNAIAASPESCQTRLGGPHTAHTAPQRKRRGMLARASGCARATRTSALCAPTLLARAREALIAWRHWPSGIWHCARSTQAWTHPRSLLRHLALFVWEVTNLSTRFQMRRFVQIGPQHTVNSGSCAGPLGAYAHPCSMSTPAKRQRLGTTAIFASLGVRTPQADLFSATGLRNRSLSECFKDGFDIVESLRRDAGNTGYVHERPGTARACCGGALGYGASWLPTDRGFASTRAESPPVRGR